MACAIFLAFHTCTRPRVTSTHSSREAVADLDRVTEVGATGVGGHAEHEGELGDTELRDQGCTRSGDRQLALGTRHRRGVVDGLDGVHDRPLHGQLELLHLGCWFPW